MILQHLSRVILNIKFTSDDWDNGRARAVMDYLKTLPKGCKYYNPKEHLWRVNKEKAGIDAVHKIFEMQDAIFSTGTPIVDDFNEKNWLDDTFGKKVPII